MSRKPNPKIETFVKDALRTGATRIELRQTSRENPDREARIDGWTLTPSMNALDLARAIDEVALDDSTGLGGVNVYALLAWVGEEERYSARRLFRCKGEDLDDTIAPSESATIAGMRSMEMRHNEALAQIGQRGVGDLFDQWRTLVDELKTRILDLEAENRALTADRLKVYALLEQLTSAQAERELVVKREERKDEAMKKAFSKLDVLFPVVLHKLFGGKESNLVPQHRQMLTEFMKTFTPTQLEALSSTFTPEQQVVLLSLFADFMPPDKMNGVSAPMTEGATS